MSIGRRQFLKTVAVVVSGAAVIPTKPKLRSIYQLKSVYLRNKTTGKRYCIWRDGKQIFVPVKGGPEVGWDDEVDFILFPGNITRAA